jgi:hypothetical protein
MMKIKFVVRFMDWRPNDVADLDKDRAKHYIDLGVGKEHKPRKKRVAAPRNKRAVAPDNK